MIFESIHSIGAISVGLSCVWPAEPSGTSLST